MKYGDGKSFDYGNSPLDKNDGFLSDLYSAVKNLPRNIGTLGGHWKNMLGLNDDDNTSKDSDTVKTSGGTIDKKTNKPVNYPHGKI